MKNNLKGFTLLELLVGAAVASFLLIGAYRLFLASSSQVSKTVVNTRDRMSVEKVLDQIAGQIRNSYDINDSGAPLRLNKSPANCADETVTSSILAFPGLDKTAVGILNASAIDPSTANINNAIDGIRVAYVPSDSYPTDLSGTKVSDGVFKPYPTNDAADYKIHIGDENAFKAFNIGDYFILSDTSGIRFGRITGKDIDNNESYAPYILNHSSNSIWNSDRSVSRNYGLNEDGSRKTGGATIQKAAVATYAYSASDKTLWVNDHVADDGFNPLDKSFNYATGLGNDWRKLLEGLDRFTIEYIVQDKNGNRFRTRQPIAGLMLQSGDCGNQLGLPYLKQVHVKMDLDGESYERLITPPRLRGLDKTSSSVHLASPVPTATPNLTPVITPTVGMVPTSIVTPTPIKTFPPTPTPCDPKFGVCPTPTASPTQTPTAVPTMTPTPTDTPTPTAGPTTTPSPVPSPTCASNIQCRLQSPLPAPGSDQCELFDTCDGVVIGGFPCEGDPTCPQPSTPVPTPTPSPSPTVAPTPTPGGCSTCCNAYCVDNNNFPFPGACALIKCSDGTVDGYTPCSNCGSFGNPCCTFP